MTTGEKISKLRKENNYTQEQLSHILGVSRQSISKWESNIAYPETDKLIRISELFVCSLDYLLKEEMEDDSRPQESQIYSSYLLRRTIRGIDLRFLWSAIAFLRRTIRERKSKKTIWGLPVWHIGKNAKGIISIGLNAKGLIAIGLRAQGLISIGMLSLGVFSFGMLSLGLILSIGSVALGIFSAGAFAAGVFSTGAISFGIISLGSIAIGDFSVGPLAIGKYFAAGDHARAMIALGETKAYGSAFRKIGKLSSTEITTVKALLSANVPSYLIWAKNMIQVFIS